MKMAADGNRLVRTLTAAVLGTLVVPALATDFEFGDGWKGDWESSVSLGTSVRARARDPKLISAADAKAVGLSGGTGNNTVDAGDANYAVGDAFSTPLKLITEVEGKKGDLGFLIRGKAWNDFALKDDAVALGSQNNGWNGYSLQTGQFGQPKALNDSGFEPLNRFSNAYLLDAYVYDTFDIAGKPLQIRAGNQVVNWGESLFVQGINQINPIDVPSFRKPGAQLKEVFLPVPILFADQNLGDYGSLDLFWQWKWQNTPIEAGCGNYWEVAFGNIGYSPGTCSNAVSLAGPAPVGQLADAYVNTIDGKKPGNSGEYGMAYRFTSDRLDTEFGLYAMQIHSRTPIVSVQFGAGGTQVPFAAEWEYPKDIHVFGLSAATNLLGWSVGSELSRRTNAPAQIDGNDLLLSGLGAGGMISPGNSIAFGPYGRAALAALAGNGYLTGVGRTNITQFQVNTVKAGNRILGADQYIFVAEAAGQWNTLPRADAGGLRYNRAFIFGPGSAAGYGGNTCASGLNVNVDGCANSGYATPFAWGYRLKLDLTYNDVFGGVSVTPNVFWSQDVRGNSIDNQFLNSRTALSLGVKFTYARNYTFDVSAVTYNHNATYDPLRDRDFYSANASIAF